MHSDYIHTAGAKKLIALLLLFSLAMAQLVTLQKAAASLDVQYHCAMMPSITPMSDAENMPDCVDMTQPECADEHCMTSSAVIAGSFDLALVVTSNFVRSANVFADSVPTFPPYQPPISA